MKTFIKTLIISFISASIYSQDVCVIGMFSGPISQTIDIQSYQYDNHKQLEELICYNELSLGYYSSLILSHPEYDRQYEIQLKGYNCENDMFHIKLNAVTWINRFFLDEMSDDDYYLNSLANPDSLYFYSESQYNNLIGIEWLKEHDQTCFLESVWQGLNQLYCLSIYHPEIELERRTFFLSQYLPPPPPTVL